MANDLLKRNHPKTRYYLDWEFVESIGRLEPLSIGVVCDDGREFYRENANADWTYAKPWVRDNVLPHLHGLEVAEGEPSLLFTPVDGRIPDVMHPEVMPTQRIAAELRQFVASGKHAPEMWGYYCVSPGTKTLTTQLRWVEAGSLAIGDELIGFDEHAPPGAGRSSARRRWKRSVVEDNSIIERPCYDLVFSDGTTVRCSSDHQWLTDNGKKPWITTEGLRCSDNLASNVVKPVDVWEHDQSRDAGYLAAAFDGEGHIDQADLSNRKRTVNTLANARLGFAQRDNEMLAEVRRILTSKSFTYTGMTKKYGDVYRLTVGQRADFLRLLGSIRPVRLLPKFNPDRLGAMLKMRTVRLVSKTPVGNQEVVALKTSTKTYLAEGLASHNCDTDWVLTYRLFGGMLDLPRSWPQFCLDLMQECYLRGIMQPKRVVPLEGTEHNALDDARWTRDLFNFLAGVDK